MVTDQINLNIFTLDFLMKEKKNILEVADNTNLIACSEFFKDWWIWTISDSHAGILLQNAPQS